jgi:opacity protein-like surface antigen
MAGLPMLARWAIWSGMIGLLLAGAARAGGEPTDARPVEPDLAPAMPTADDDAPWRWQTPYAAGKATECESTAPLHWATGMFPWSPRTPYTHRHAGPAEPLLSTSWRNRPWTLGVFYGAMWGESLIDDRVDQHEGFFGGVRLGWDYDYYWGTELRVGVVGMELADQQGQDLRHMGEVDLFDLSLVYYPWGDSRWRPYCSIGLGFDLFHFQDPQGNGYDEVLLGLPLGLGVKYGLSESVLLRLEVVDNLAIENGLVETMHNVSLAAGMEVRFGGRKVSYYPWNPSRKLR